MSSPTVGRFKRWFWRPPRVHGDIIVDRRVTFLELFYDLVYVVVISQATGHLAENISIRTLAEFCVVFGMIWVAWINGSLYLELHGREDGRTRTLVFIQMGILAVLAVYTAEAGDATGPQFAFVSGAFLVVMTWAWFMVRRQDRLLTPKFLPVTGRYVVLMLVSVAVLVGSAFVPDDIRLVIWAGYVIVWIVAFWLLDRMPGTALAAAVTPTDSLVERFGLFTIIVLGEVVFGVVEGLSLAEHDLTTISTGVIGLGIGFGFWWIYFDLVGHRPPRAGHTVVSWVLSHFPITISIALSGAAMVSLIEHAHDASTPVTTAWLLSGAVAMGLVAQIVAMRTLVDAERLSTAYRPMNWALAAAAVVTLAVGWLAPAPWILAAAIGAILTVLWFICVALFIRADAWGEEPTAGS